MRERIYIIKAGDFKNSKYGKFDKWSEFRFAKVVANGQTHNFEENGEEFALILRDGDKVSYTSGFAMAHTSKDVDRFTIIDFEKKERLIDFSK